MLDRLRPGVDDEMPWRPGGRNTIELRFEAERKHRLLFGMSIAGGDERQRLDDGCDNRRIVFAERLSGDERTHIQKSIRLICGVAIDGSEIGADRLRRIERYRP